MCPCPMRNAFVGLLGIEPRSHAPEACILPLYYSPIYISHRANSHILHLTIVSHEIWAGGACILPLYYSPF